MLADKTLVKKLIPQDNPMIMVDGLVFNDEESTISTLTLSKENIFCKDGYFHEPGLVENIAQTAALRSGYNVYLNEESPSIGYIGSLKKMRIYKLPRDNDKLTTKISVLTSLMNVLVIVGEISVGSSLIAEGELNIFLQS